MLMTVPTIHLNGTTKEQLLEQIENAWAAVNAAIDALKQMAPHGRDYYPQGPDAITRARDQHLARMRKLQDVCDDLETLAQAIQDPRGHDDKEAEKLEAEMWKFTEWMSRVGACLKDKGCDTYDEELARHLYDEGCEATVAASVLCCAAP